jgi:phage-related protein
MTDRPLAWVGSSKEDLSGLPKPVKAYFGFQLRQVQQGRSAADAKALTQFGSGVVELRTSFDTNAYRTVYIVKLKHAVYVLHAFMKKSKSGIGLSKRDSELIASRLKRAREMDAELS